MANMTPRTSLDKKPIEHVEEADFNNTILQRYALISGKSEKELSKLNKSVLRKLDWKFLPMATMMLLMNYLDRINVSNARLAGMQEDCHMTDIEWSAGISLFYVGYIIGQIPGISRNSFMPIEQLLISAGNVIIAKSKPRIILPICMLAWSVVTICMTAMRSPWSFMLCRFLVGLTEGPFLPAVSLMTSSWYTKHESPVRMGIWHAGVIISNVFSGLLAAAILTNMDGIATLHAWQWFILIEGEWRL
ncbi:hypothetical protein LTR22_002698 [Elasticomyces elasticus]|nr:hypothetical protein LTR22_002698 [Elasticomyces elasticus]KAK4931213.1 hypothetical protein LTR49_002271 [Elasticomyces elasticus]KAK5767856.1 hypothetical protein LTS12_002008 [Elasticomyces elasticus]